MSKATKRKHVRQEVCDSDWQPPGPGQALARVLAGRGNNLHEVMVAGDIPPASNARSSSPHVILSKTGPDSALGKTSNNEKVDVTASATDKLKTIDKQQTYGDDAGTDFAEGDVNGKVSLQGNNWAEKRILASMPRKFRRSVWVRRGDVVIVEWIPEGDRVKAEIVSVLLRKMVRSLRISGELEWPQEFDHPDFGDVEKSRSSSDSDEDDDNDDSLPVNTNRRPALEIETSSSTSSTSSSSYTSSTSSDDEDSESEDEGGAGSVYENPNRRTVSRSASKSESSQSDVENATKGKAA